MELETMLKLVRKGNLKEFYLIDLSGKKTRKLTLTEALKLNPQANSF